MRRNEIGDELKDLAFDFLYFFARFEFALKANGYLKKTEPGQPAEAGWVAFRERWKDGYKLTESAEALIEANPKKQMVGEDGSLEFRPATVADNTSDLERVVILCNVVRNNLFHGGKSSNDGFDSPERTKLLLSLVLGVLGELAEACDLRPDYSGYY
ncbi:MULTISPECIES: hypothetical protein [Rhizobium]|uniref:Uncharacterized protein n=1 Tax=Rhizobium tumorigenes TaxID=2041385 RepID=A0AAF1K9P1_9HYPH|nr:MULTISPECIES: hypothetical protein [Rhizobium]MBO9102347.1 hypothetical protein [Rhizobium sp. L58/93]MBO9172390.1 hypothetical protein [Rhizobium sp. L245/93]MBO9188183.1 hypothetical protein [Rhizobium sp. E27B/91]QXZ87518.1 hypothetical protein J5287_27785 [Rhizobium sp. K1/93]QXZ93558.1 hypothetical protein J5280_27785 [Rhizobium sp. K15/93]